jgi:hypothetical protein
VGNRRADNMLLSISMQSGLQMRSLTVIDN